LSIVLHSEFLSSEFSNAQLGYTPKCGVSIVGGGQIPRGKGPRRRKYRLS
jgi:hypothetical protein